MYRNIQRLSAMVLALFNVGLSSATSACQIKRERLQQVAAVSVLVLTCSPGWRQAQRFGVGKCWACFAGLLSIAWVLMGQAIEWVKARV